MEKVCGNHLLIFNYIYLFTKVNSSNSIKNCKGNSLAITNDHEGNVFQYLLVKVELLLMPGLRCTLKLSLMFFIDQNVNALLWKKCRVMTLQSPRQAIYIDVFIKQLFVLSVSVSASSENLNVYFSNSP